MAYGEGRVYVIAGGGLLIASAILVGAPLTTAYELFTVRAPMLDYPLRAAAFAVSAPLVVFAYVLRRRQLAGRPSKRKIFRMWGATFWPFTLVGAAVAAVIVGLGIRSDLQYDAKEVEDTCNDLMPNGAALDPCRPIAQACLVEDRRNSMPKADGSRMSLSGIRECVREKVIAKKIGREGL